MSAKKKSVEVGSKASVPLVLVTRLFQLVSERKFAEAERIFERITERMKKNENNEYNRGYLYALRGVIITHRSGNDTDVLLSNLNLNDVEALKRYYKEFLSNAKNKFYAEYDKGYFSALSDYMRVLMKTAQGKNEKSGG